jgi:3-oxoacyl-(acyl-carrier-protein) synthase
LTGGHVYVTGMGIVSPVGKGIANTRRALRTAACGIRPLSLFAAADGLRLPVGEVDGPLEAGGLPRTHALALTAAREALNRSPGAIDAVVIGSTTGGILTTEELFKAGATDPHRYDHHSVGSVADAVADDVGCNGPVLSVSTACSSGTAAVKIALELMRTGRYRRVLAGGADSLCRLTYYGFNALQLIDPRGARPFDRDRNGMSVAEGAAMLVLETHDRPPADALAEVLGGGLSCDAHHPATPHPEGLGGFTAMAAAVTQAGISPSRIGYVNLHGTGTIHNDLSEARAVHRLFGDNPPPLSSVKGALGHSLAAAGAIESVVAVLSIVDGLLPANTAGTRPDPNLQLKPVPAPTAADVGVVLSNSFGFGGNNAAVVIGKTGLGLPGREHRSIPVLAVAGRACLTGAGATAATLAAVTAGRDCRGRLDDRAVANGLSPAAVRRLQRLPRMVLSLAVAACAGSCDNAPPASIFFGTGWGPLSETHDFLELLPQSAEALASPTRFVGSVHNAPAAQAAIHFGATGANITAVGGDYSFEQALLMAALVGDAPGGASPRLVIGADEYHACLSDRFDASVRSSAVKSDGGGALCLKPELAGGPCIRPVPIVRARSSTDPVDRLVAELGGPERINAEFGGLLLGVPAAFAAAAQPQRQRLLTQTRFSGPVIDYRDITGQYATASATAAVLGIEWIISGAVPGCLWPGPHRLLAGKGLLLVGFGPYLTAVELLARPPV